MSDNWVVQNLENALETWNEKLAEIWQLITCLLYTSLGEYRGFTMELYFEAREYKVRLKGELGYPVTLGTDTFGNICLLYTSEKSCLPHLPKRKSRKMSDMNTILAAPSISVQTSMKSRCV